MNLGQALQTPKVVNIKGVDYPFDRLNIYDLIKIDALRKGELKKIADTNAQKAKLKSADLYNVFCDIDAQDFNVAQILGLAQTPKGAVNIVAYSLSKKEMKPDDIKALLSQLNPVQLVDLAAELIFESESEKNEGSETEVVTEISVSPDALISTVTESGPKAPAPEHELAFGE